MSIRMECRSIFTTRHGLKHCVPAALPRRFSISMRAACRWARWRWFAVAEDGGGLYERRRQAAHVLHVRSPRPGFHRAAYPQLCVEFRAGSQGRLGLLGLFQTTTSCAMPAALRRRKKSGHMWPSLRSRCLQACAVPFASIRARNLVCRRQRLPSRICRTPMESASGLPSRAANGPYADALGGGSGVCRVHHCRQALAAGAGASPGTGRRSAGARSAIGAVALPARACLPPQPQGTDARIDRVSGDSDDVLAFVRRRGGRAMLFVYNLTRVAQSFALPGNLLPLPVPNAPGFAGTLTAMSWSWSP